LSGRCEVCGKKTVFGRRVSFSNRHSSRTFKPNVQKTMLVLDGVRHHVYACTRCMRTNRKQATV